MGKRVKTSINLDVDLVEEVRASGVRALGRYVEGLMRADLKQMRGISESEDARIRALQQKLEDIDRRWREDVKRGRV